jgi:hypothetical protein
MVLASVQLVAQVKRQRAAARQAGQAVVPWADREREGAAQAHRREYFVQLDAVSGRRQQVTRAVVQKVPVRTVLRARQTLRHLEPLELVRAAGPPEPLVLQRAAGALQSGWRQRVQPAAAARPPEVRAVQRVQPVSQQPEQPEAQEVRRLRQVLEA